MSVTLPCLLEALLEVLEMLEGRLEWMLEGRLEWRLEGRWLSERGALMLMALGATRDASKSAAR